MSQYAALGSAPTAEEPRLAFRANLLSDNHILQFGNSCEIIRRGSSEWRTQSLRASKLALPTGFSGAEPAYLKCALAQSAARYTAAQSTVLRIAR